MECWDCNFEDSCSTHHVTALVSAVISQVKPMSFMPILKTISEILLGTVPGSVLQTAGAKKQAKMAGHHLCSA